MVPARIGIITLGVADLERATAFYGALGWPPCEPFAPGITFIRTAGPMLALFPHDDLAADARVEGGRPESFRGVTLALNVDTDDEVLRILDEAQAAGATITKPAETSEFFAGLDGYFADPDGHAWEVAHNPDLSFATATGSTVIVAGHLLVDPSDRDGFVADSAEFIRTARGTEGCLDFAVSADPVDPARINVLEQWASPAALAAFRGDGPDNESASRIREMHVHDHLANPF